MKKLLFAVVVLFVGSQIFAQNQASKFDFTPDQLKAVDTDSRYCPQDLFTNPSYEKIDVRSCDLSKYDLRFMPRPFLEKLTFNDKTIWPQILPEWLDVRKIYQISKTPGLHIRDLHKQGITGAGVGIAIIDKSLSPHQEYNTNLAFYKDFTGQDISNLHGAAVSSIAVGQSVGVAPGAKLYYIATNFFNYDEEKNIFNAKPFADIIEYLLALNKTLPTNQKIFVISISRGFDERDYGRKDFLKALDKARKQGVLVLTTDNVSCMNRKDFYVNAENRDSYTYFCHWVNDLTFAQNNPRLSVPTDYKIFAAHTGERDYVAYANGGLSWAVPYLAGIAALAKQVKPDLTPDEFLEVAFETAQSVQVKTKNSKKTAQLDTFVNPHAVIKELQRRKHSLNKEKKENIESLEKGLKTLPQKVKGGN